MVLDQCSGAALGMSGVAGCQLSVVTLTVNSYKYKTLSHRMKVSMSCSQLIILLAPFNVDDTTDINPNSKSLQLSNDFCDCKSYFPLLCIFQRATKAI
jgi:hypothetical protein